MRKAIVYASVHHGNTEKLVKSIAEGCQVDLIDAVKQPDADLSSYDMIGFASGIYLSLIHISGIWQPLYWLWSLQFCLSDMYLFYYAGYFL